MSLAQYFPVMDKLPEADKKTLLDTAVLRGAKQGTLLHSGQNDCMGLLVIRSGQLRAYITSDEGKEITLYRLFERDICLFSAACVMSSIQFDIMIGAEKDTEFWVIPPWIYKGLVERSAEMANYVNQLMATRFTDVMWLMEQVMWKSFDKRLGAFLLEESNLENSLQLKITHEQIAAHLGSAREVVTRMLKYFQNEGMVTLTRGAIQITDAERLEAYCED
ncbi:MAG: Crp/Fnr family transcriptional regulator [Oscillospiraceae bacterium]|nr:Crp/Fnr family transcriptional regulator [Oscillospiraceae bacterium]